MTKLAVVAYPTLAEPDRRWIESVRAIHDPQAARIAPHFTLVFPADVDRESLVAETAALCARSRPVAFSLDRIEAVRDLGGSGAHLFLVPGKGHREIVGLHDELYAGVCRVHLREDLPFVPHVTVAFDSDPERCVQLAAALEKTWRPLHGTIARLDVVVVSPDTVESLAALPLSADAKG
jgi:2'-5' RNA ligase